MIIYVALYGFCRTIALIFVLVFWSFVAAIPLRIAAWSCSLAGAAASGCLAYIFLDFLKFYLEARGVHGIRRRVPSYPMSRLTTRCS